jgi:F-type H+-transporting ATPase subunit a
MEVLVVVKLILVFLFVRSRLSVDKPGATQHLAEMMNAFIAKQGEEIIGHGSERFVPFLVSLFFGRLSSWGLPSKG